MFYVLILCLVAIVITDLTFTYKCITGSLSLKKGSGKKSYISY